MITVGFKTDKGIQRRDNEDSIFIIPDKKVFIVADGVGGHSSGQLASRMTVGYMAQYIAINPLDLIENPATLKKYFSELFDGANTLIHEKSLNEPINYGMATTTVLCYIRDYTAYFVNVGDSRAYLIRNNNMFQITEDHTFFETLIREGTMSRSEAESKIEKNVITRAIGGDYEVYPDFFTLDIYPGDTIILCSDGLYNEVAEEEMIEFNASCETMHDLANDLVDAANYNGGHDNISVVCIKVQ